MQRILAHKIQTPGNHTKERIQPSQHSSSFKSRMQRVLCISISHSVLTVLICLPEIQKFHCSIILVLYSFVTCEKLVSKILQQLIQSNFLRLAPESCAWKTSEPIFSQTLVHSPFNHLTCLLAQESFIELVIFLQIIKLFL